MGCPFMYINMAILGLTTDCQVVAVMSLSQMRGCLHDPRRLSTGQQPIGFGAATGRQVRLLVPFDSAL